MEVDEVVLTLIGKIKLHRAEASDATHLRVDGGLDQGAGNRCINGVTASL
jgi:hypothetical protein